MLLSYLRDVFTVAFFIGIGLVLIYYNFVRLFRKKPKAKIIPNPKARRIGKFQGSAATFVR